MNWNTPALEQAASARLQPPIFGYTDADPHRVQLIGQLGSEPLLCTVGDHSVAYLTLASVARCQGAQHESGVQTPCFNLAAWEELADYCGRWLHKGDWISIEGCLQGWTQTRDGRNSGCHTVVLERIVLLHAGENVAASGATQTTIAYDEGVAAEPTAHGGVL